MFGFIMFTINREVIHYIYVNYLLLPHANGDIDLTVCVHVIGLFNYILVHFKVTPGPSRMGQLAYTGTLDTNIFNN